MIAKRIRALLASLLLVSTCAAAHEFWLLPDRFDAAPNTEVNLSIWVGENFKGEQVGISTPLVASLKQYTAKGTVDLNSTVPADTPVANLPIPSLADGYLPLVTGVSIDS